MRGGLVAILSVCSKSRRCALVLQVLDRVRDAVPRLQALHREAQLPQLLLEGQRVGALDRLPGLPGRLCRSLLGLQGSP